MLRQFIPFVAILLFLGTSCEEPIVAELAVKESEAAASATIYTRTNWMGALSGSLSLTQITIPGTHDSGARYEPWPGTAICQDLSVAEQLDAGTRFLDIRCRHIDDAFAIHHGSIYQNLNFDDVLNACTSFLNVNPSECIIMSVKEEYDPANNTRTFEATFDSYVEKDHDVWYLDASIPALSSVRGKIVLLRRFSASSTPKGLYASPWYDNTTFEVNSTANMKIQDIYQVSSTSSKWSAITSLFSDAVSGSSDRLYINFTSGYKSGIFGIPDINAVSNTINPQLTSYFTINTFGRYGIIPMDFAEGDRNELIISTNF